LPVLLYSLHGTSMLEKPAKAIGVAKVISKSDIFASLIQSLEEVLPGGASVESAEESAKPTRRATQRKRQRKKISASGAEREGSLGSL
jgi:hypothetical protein